MRKLSSLILIAVLLMGAVVATPTVGLAADARHKEPDIREMQGMSADKLQVKPSLYYDLAGQSKARKGLAEGQWAAKQATHYMQRLVPDGISPIHPQIASNMLPTQCIKTLFARLGAGLYAGVAKDGQMASRSRTLFGTIRAMFVAVPPSYEANACAKPHETAGIDERGYIRIPLDLLADAEDQDEVVMQEIIALLPQSPGMSAIICAMLDNGRVENHTGAREVFGRVVRSRSMIAEAVRMTEEEPEVFSRAQVMARSILETSSVSFARVRTQGDGRIQWWDGQNTDVPGEIYKTLRVEHTTFTSSQTRVAHLRYYTDDECLYIMGVLRNCKMLNRDWNVLAPEV